MEFTFKHDRPFLKTKTLVLVISDKDGVKYKNKSISLDDLIGIKFDAINTRLKYGSVSLNTKYEIVFFGESDKVVLKFETHTNYQDVDANVTSLLNFIVEDLSALIIQNLMKRQGKNTIIIGDFYFSRGKVKYESMVSTKDIQLSQIIESKFEKGYLNIIYMNTNGKRKIIKTPMKKRDTLLIPLAIKLFNN